MRMIRIGKKEINDAKTDRKSIVLSSIVRRGDFRGRPSFPFPLDVRVK